ncbi:MAG: hypothetical protein ACK5NK_06475 [Niabella sp.]
MKKVSPAFLIFAVTSVIVFIFSGCGDKDIDNRETYFDVKINGAWVDYSEQANAGFTDNAVSFGSVRGTKGVNKFYFNFMTTPIRYSTGGGDTASVKPYNKYDLNGWAYETDNAEIIGCGTASSNTHNSNCNITRVVITNDNNGIFEGYLEENTSNSTNSISITGCRFRVKPSTPVPFK